MTVASTIQEQIPLWLRRAVGYHAAVDTGSGLRFRCRGRGNYTVTVAYDHASDLYDVAVITRNGPRSRVFYTADQVYADTMVDIINRIDRGRIAP